jgi:hypothetical protein
MQLRSNRIYGMATGAHFWWAELLGYFTVDISLVMYYRKTVSNFWGTLMHHCVSMVAYSVVMVQRRLAWYGCALIMQETTTPFGNFRWIVRARVRSSALDGCRQLMGRACRCPSLSPRRLDVALPSTTRMVWPGF